MKTIVYLFICLFAGTVNANLITNGSFENASIDPDDGSHAVGPFARLAAGDSSIFGWDILNGGIDYIGSSIWDASDGTRSIDLDSATAGAPGSIEQTFSTTASLTYTVQFDMAGNYAGGPAIKPLEVSIDGVASFFNFDSTGKSGTAMGWTNMMFSFVANDNLATLNFKSLLVAPDTGFGAAIDNVSVDLSSVTVPEPSSLALFGLGFAGIGFARKKNNS